MLTILLAKKIGRNINRSAMRRFLICYLELIQCYTE